MDSFINRDSTDFDLDLIIPALNEESRIGNTITAICLELERAPFRTRLLVVDNGSVDATAEAVDAAHAASTKIEIIGCRHRGKGAAVRAGVTFSNARNVGYCDADLSTPPGAITAGYELLESGWDAVIGSRRCAGSNYNVAQPWVRRMGSKVFNASASHLVGPFSDTQCGFKLFKSVVAKDVFQHLQLNGFAFDVELLARLNMRGCRITELPIQWSDQKGSSFRVFSDGIVAFKDLYSVHRSIQPVADA